MSIILDALRKAEASRRGDDRLGLTTAPVRRTPLYARIPLGFVAAAATLFLSVGVGAWLLWPEGQEHAAVAGSEPSPAPGSMPAQAPSGAQSPEPAKSPAAEAAMTATEPTAPAPAGAGGTARPEGAVNAPPAAGTAPSPKQGPADVRMLAMEARLAEPPAPAAAPPARGGSVQVQDLMGTGGGAGAGPEDVAPPAKPTRSGSVEVRDLLAEQGVEPVGPEAPEAEAGAVLSEADGGIVTLPTGARPATAKPASAARNPGAPPGATLPPQAAPPLPRAAPDVPSLDDLVASGQLNPPDLSLDMHAYGPDAAARFVYINMRRYHIGDTTREGAVVEDITPDGVVLQLQGRRFALSAR